jgi:tRNA-specific 2-thiouridylase
MSTKQVVVAMSGGVDSSVAAALLKEQGYDLIGVTMVLSCTTSSSDRSCCSMSAAADAKKVADILGIPHYTLNFKDEFKRDVIDNFIEEYKNGRTPNPCIRCNQLIKFDLLLKKAEELGAKFVATGHYARIESRKQSAVSSQPEYILKKGIDNKKDQAYVLYRLNQETLQQVLFPLGEMTKEDVRKRAKELKLPVADKKESQEICFIEDDDYVRFLKEKVPEAVKPGPILDREGNVVGEHEGIAFYTIGQRKGVGAHKGQPKYVIGIDPVKNAVIIGDDEDTLKSELKAEAVSFISGEIPSEPLAVTAKIRYNSTEAEAVLLPGGEGNGVRVEFEEPQRAVTPGQSVVFYKGDEVIGGGIISR